MAEQPDSYVSSYEEESFTDSVVKSFQTKPAFMTSIVALVGACGVGAYRYKTRGMTFTPSLYLIQLRVGAQATVVGCLTIGMIYKMLQDHVFNKNEKHKS